MSEWVSERGRQRLSNEITFNEHQWLNIEVSIASLTGSVLEFRVCSLRSLEGKVPNYTKDFSHPQGYIHPKWAFLPTGPSLSQTIDNRPVLATTIRTFEHLRMRIQRNPRNLSSLLTVQTIPVYEYELDGMVS